jgi:peptidoglycan-N-acetylglucosamine deacetylase
MPEIISTRSERYPNIVLTFDDGPNPDWTPKILDLLNDNGVKATFFCLGKNAENYPEIIKRMHKEGHLICNLGYSHRNFRTLSRDEVVNELSRTRDIIKNILNNSIITKYHIYGAPYDTFYRAPGGKFPDFDVGLVGIKWSVNTEDEIESEKYILSKMQEAQKGDIILCHDGIEKGILDLDEGDAIGEDLDINRHKDRSRTLEALKIAIPELQKKNLKFVTIDDTIKDIRNTKSWICLDCGKVLRAHEWMAREIYNTEPGSERAYYFCPNCGSRKEVELTQSS